MRTNVRKEKEEERERKSEKPLCLYVVISLHVYGAEQGHQPQFVYIASATLLSNQLTAAAAADKTAAGKAV